MQSSRLFLVAGPAVEQPVRRAVNARAVEVRVLEGALYNDWQTVYEENVLSVYRQIFARVGNRPDAEDLTSEAFLKSLPKLSLPAPVSQVRAYINATVHTLLADHWRRHYGSPLADVEVDNVASTPKPVLANEGSGRAGRILALLPERSRRILELRFLRGYSIREAASEMAISPGNAKILQYRALRLAAEVGAGMLS
jgi:RNA polymerase sigma factor (sigma-70 family)